jgi:hypothetical protein
LTLQDSEIPKLVLLSEYYLAKYPILTDSSKAYAFRLYSDHKPSFIMCAATSEEMNEWMNALYNHTINKPNAAYARVSITNADLISL